MLVIRREQMRTLDELMRAKLFRQLVDGLAGLAPHEDVRTLQAYATVALDIGQRLGVASGAGFGRVASLLIDLGPAFVEHPAIAAVLADASRSPDERVAALFAFDGATWARIRADLAR